MTLGMLIKILESLRDECGEEVGVEAALNQHANMETTRFTRQLGVEGAFFEPKTNKVYAVVYPCKKKDVPDRRSPIWCVG